MGNELTLQNYNQQRQILGEILPLNMPLSIQIQVTNLCNFKCFYCSASQTPEERKKEGLQLRHMPFEDFKLCIDRIAEAGGTKVLNLVGWGEPLLHPHIADMVQYAKNVSAAGFVRIVSNGSLLTPKMSDALIQAGLDNLRVSLQGTCQEDYKKMSNVDINFQELTQNLKYFYEHKQNSTLSLKIMDISIAGKEEEFKRIFSNLCDEYLIDALVEINENINFAGHGSNLNHGFLCGDFIETDICSVPFYRGFIDVDSQLFPCCHLPMICKFGDVRNGFSELWSGKTHIQFLLDLLTGQTGKYKGCQNCKMYLNQLLPADQLDDYRSGLIEKYQTLLTSAQ